MSTYQYQPIPTQEQVVEQELPYGTMMDDEDIVIGEYRVKWGTIREVLDEKGLAHTDENVIGIMLHAIMARVSAQ